MPSLLHRAGTRGIEIAQKRVKMKKREREALERRLRKLNLAIIMAGQRLRNERAPFVITIATTGLGADYSEDGLTVEMVITMETLGSWRVGKHPSGEFFELKFVPTILSLALPQKRTEKDSGPQLYLPVRPVELIQLYQPKDIQRIIRLVDAIQPGTN